MYSLRRMYCDPAFFQACRNFIKWNFEMVAVTNDFGNFQSDILAQLLQQNDLVVHSEMVLCEYV
jgi:hypothetical protein